MCFKFVVLYLTWLQAVKHKLELTHGIETWSGFTESLLNNANKSILAAHGLKFVLTITNKTQLHILHYEYKTHCIYYTTSTRHTAYTILRAQDTLHILYYEHKTHCIYYTTSTRHTAYTILRAQDTLHILYYEHKTHCIYYT